MFTLVTGASASGKSQYAEDILTASGVSPRFYIATMRVFDAEGEARVARHRAMRAQKGFETIEAPVALAEVSVPGGSAVLLECLSNLAANECFGGAGFEGAKSAILAGVEGLAARTSELVVVTNEVFASGEAYGDDTGRYIDLLGEVNCAVAARADRLIEVNCGIPVLWKGASL